MMFSSLLRLEPTPDGFAAPASPDKGERVFGGQFLAQCLAAAQTDGGWRARRSTRCTATFCVQATWICRCRYGSIECAMAGRSRLDKRSRRSAARNCSGCWFPSKCRTRRLNTPSPPCRRCHHPREVAYTYDHFTLAQTNEDAWYGSDRPIEIRYVNPPSAPRGTPVTEPQLMWMRVNEALPDAPSVHRAGLTYLSDTTLVDHIPLPHGLRCAGSELRRHQLGSRHVVSSSGACGRVAVVRADRGGHWRRARPGQRPVVYTWRRTGRHLHAGRIDAMDYTEYNAGHLTGQPTAADVVRRASRSCSRTLPASGRGRRSQRSEVAYFKEHGSSSNGV